MSGNIPFTIGSKLHLPMSRHHCLAPLFFSASESADRTVSSKRVISRQRRKLDADAIRYGTMGEWQKALFIGFTKARLHKKFFLLVEDMLVRSMSFSRIASEKAECAGFAD